jgi:hypothetical protein
MPTKVPQQFLCSKCGWTKPVARGRPPLKCPHCGGTIQKGAVEPCPVKVTKLTVTHNLEVEETPVEAQELPEEDSPKDVSQSLTDKEQRKLQELLEGRY